MPRLLRAAVMAAFLFAPTVAFAQGGIVQSGPVSPGHIPAWGGNGSLLDPGNRGANLTGPLGLGTWPTTGRPTAPLNGTFGLNTTLNSVEVFTSGAWVSGLAFLGGSVPNPITVPSITLAGTTLNWTDATAPRNLNAHNAWTGTSTQTAAVGLNRILSSDTITASVAAGAQFVTTLDVEQQFGGHGTVGTRVALNVQSLQIAPTDTFAAGGSPNMIGANLWAFGQFNEGGTGFLPGQHIGSIFGFNPKAVLKNTATFWSEVAGGELDVAVAAGSSTFVKYGLTILKLGNDAVRGAAGLDAGLSFSDEISGGAAAPWFYGVQFGNEGGQWPFANDSVLVGSRLNSADATVIGAAKWDLDFLSNTTTKGLIQGPNFHVSSTGITRVGFGALKPDTAGMVITADGKQAATATIAAAGTGYSPGYAYDVNGNIWHIDSVNVSGGITAVTIFQAVQTATATTPIAMAPNPYFLGAAGASLTVSYASGTDIIMPNLPTSAPATHCALWSNSNVITRTTCP